MLKDHIQAPQFQGLIVCYPSVEKVLKPEPYMKEIRNYKRYRGTGAPTLSTDFLFVLLYKFVSVSFLF